MTTWLTKSTLSLTAALLTTSATFASEPIVIDDNAIRTELLDGVGALVDAKKTTHGDELSKQLSRKTCTIKPPTPSTKDKKNIYESCAESVVVIGSVYKCDNCSNWHASGMATAWILTEDGVMVTNYHVFAGKSVKGMGIRTLDGTVAPVIEILAADKDADVAIFRVAGKGFKPLPLGPSPAVSTDISIIAHPDSRYYTYTSGRVSRYYQKRSKSRSPIMTVTADFARGSSGGPILDPAGNVVGMVASTQSIYYPPKKKTDKKGPFQMVIHNCVPVSSIKALIKTP